MVRNSGTKLRYYFVKLLRLNIKYRRNRLFFSPQGIGESASLFGGNRWNQ